MDKYNNVDSIFISKLLRGEKGCFKNNEINRVILPHYSELCMKNLIEQIKDDNQVKHYLHDKFETKKKPSRQFLLDIIGTVYPGYFQEVIQAQTNERFQKQASEEVGNHILVTDDWVTALQEHPFESSKYLAFRYINLICAEKKGKFLSFLKAKAKPIQPRKAKTQYELKTNLQEFKRRKVDSEKIHFNVDPEFNLGEAAQ